MRYIFLKIPMVPESLQPSKRRVFGSFGPVLIIADHLSHQKMNRTYKHELVQKKHEWKKEIILLMAKRLVSYRLAPVYVSAARPEPYCGVKT